MGFTNNTNNTFPPSPLQPLYRIWRDWCIGDSLGYLNDNFLYLETLINSVSASRGIVLQQAYNENSTFTVIPDSPSVQFTTSTNVNPGSSRGSLFLTTSATPITPSSLNNFFLVQYSFYPGYNISGSVGVVSAISRYTNGALETDVIYTDSNSDAAGHTGSGRQGVFRVPVTSLTPTWFQLRVGSLDSDTGTIYLNGASLNQGGTQGPLFGNTIKSTLLIQEIRG
jgi:hypothetical protein